MAILITRYRRVQLFELLWWVSKCLSFVMFGFRKYDFFRKLREYLNTPKSKKFYFFKIMFFFVFMYSRNFRKNRISKYFEEFRKISSIFAFSKIRLKFEFRKNWTWIHKKIIVYIFRKFLWNFSKLTKLLELFSKFLGFRKKSILF
jgi:hypothetical protein